MQDNYPTAREVFAGAVSQYGDLIYDMATAAYDGDWDEYHRLRNAGYDLYATFDDLIDAIPEEER